MGLIWNINTRDAKFSTLCLDLVPHGRITAIRKVGPVLRVIKHNKLLLEFHVASKIKILNFNKCGIVDDGSDDLHFLQVLSMLLDLDALLLLAARPEKLTRPCDARE